MQTRAIAAALLLVSSGLLRSQTLPQPPLINVSGSAEVKVVPDEIRFNAAVETRNPKLEEAKRANDERVAKLLQFLKSQGISEKDIQTDFLGIDPNYDNKASKTDPTTYVVERAIGVRLTDIKKFDAVLSGLLGNGVNRMNGIDFRTSELRKHRDHARAMAIKAAQEKADALAAEAGIKRGKVYNINASEQGGWWSWAGSRWSGSYGGNAMQNVSQAVGASAAEQDGTMAVGQISVTATVNVSFLIE